MPKDDRIPGHLRRRKEILIARGVDVDAISVKVLGQEPGLMDFRGDSLGEVVGVSEPKGQRSNVVDVQDAAKAVSQVTSLPDGAQALP